MLNDAECSCRIVNSVIPFHSTSPRSVKETKKSQTSTFRSPSLLHATVLRWSQMDDIIHGCSCLKWRSSALSVTSPHTQRGEKCFNPPSCWKHGMKSSAISETQFTGQLGQLPWNVSDDLSQIEVESTVLALATCQPDSCFYSVLYGWNHNNYLIELSL